jgi:hypothetical protein
MQDLLNDANFAGSLRDCLKNVSVSPSRRGSQADISLHYTVELWQKAKTVNRGRAVLACTLAHLTAVRKLVHENYDVLLEDNVRIPVRCAVQRIWETLDAIGENESSGAQSCRLCYFGWLGSIPNLEWIYTTHIPSNKRDRGDDNRPSVFTMPTGQDIEDDLALKGEEPEILNNLREKNHQKPGGNPFWGCYAYWISKEAYESLMEMLQNDVGALMWKSKRMRYYQVKPIDKILPRHISSTFGKSAVQLSTHPTFFRAPMLTSKIHAKWDPEFCKSTEYQLQLTGLTWSDLHLTPHEQLVVSHHEETSEWLTLAVKESSH